MILVLDVNDVWTELPFRALGRLHPTCGASLGTAVGGTLRRDDAAPDGPSFRRVVVRAPRRWSGRMGWLLSRRLAGRLRHAAAASLEAVVFTSPAYRDLVDRFAGIRTAYYVADDYRFYGWPDQLVRGWEARMLASVHDVFAVSTALRDHLVARYGIDPARIAVSPNAVCAGVIPAVPPRGPRGTLAPIPPAFRPLAGVPGSVSDRLRLDWLVEVLDRLPWLHLAIIGPVVPDLSRQLRALDVLRRMSDRVVFCGQQSYEALTAYAQVCDVCLIPLAAETINPLASPVRFFSCLPAACPILASPGCRQLEEFEPLVRLCDSPEDMAGALEALRARGFDDGWNVARWEAAREHTWTARARGILARLRERAA